MPHTISTYNLPHPEANRRKYGGKELLTEGGLNEHDFEARRLTPLGSFSQPDPLAGTLTDPETGDRLPVPYLCHISPYAYCAADPINYTDPSGMVIDTSQLSDNDRQLYNETINFLRNYSKSFETLIQTLQESEEVYVIAISEGIIVDGVGKGGAFAPNNSNGETQGGGTINLLKIENNGSQTGFVIGLGEALEEYFHAYQHENRSIYEPIGHNYELEAKFYSKMAYTIGGDSDAFSSIFNVMRTGILEDILKEELGNFCNGEFWKTYKAVSSEFIKYYQEQKNANELHFDQVIYPPRGLIKLYKSSYNVK